MNKITTLLDQLADIRTQLDLLRLDKEKTIYEALSPEDRQRLADIEAEFATKAAAAEANAAELEEQIKRMTLEHGEAVKGANLQAVVMSGRVSWDTKRLDGFVVAHPELLAFRKVGEPSVQIRTLRGK